MKNLSKVIAFSALISTFPIMERTITVRLHIIYAAELGLKNGQIIMAIFTVRSYVSMIIILGKIMY